MKQQTEALLREHLRSVDTAVVPVTSAVGDRVSRIERRMARRRRGLAGVSAIALVGLGVGVVWNSSATQQITGADGLPSTTASVSTLGDTGPWKAIPGFAKPVSGATVVWTGTEAMMIGGTFADGSWSGINAYNPTTETWRVVAQTPFGAIGGDNPIAFWSGKALVLIDTADLRVPTYDPGGDELVDELKIFSLGSETEIIDATVLWVWTGTELLVWPKAVGDLPAPEPTAFDPITATWRTLAESPLESRADAASVWTGTEWIIWGGSRGSNYFNDGAAYNPATDTWRLLPESPLSARRAPAVWTGSEMIVVAGFSGDPVSPLALTGGAAYDPATDSWRNVAAGLAHPGFVPVWTGKLLILFAKGGAVWYDPATDQWSSGDFTWGDVAHIDASPVWTGAVVLLLGSYDGSTGGATFTPPST